MCPLCVKTDPTPGCGSGQAHLRGVAHAEYAIRRAIVFRALAAGLAAFVALVLQATTETHPTKTVQAACVRANVGGQIRCLAPRQGCARRYERSYEFYGLACERGRDGRLRLHQRYSIGPISPSMSANSP